MLAKMTFKSSASSLLESARINFGASENELLEMQDWFQAKETFPLVNQVRKNQQAAGGRNMFAAIAEVLLETSKHTSTSLKNQRFFTILFTAAAFEAGMIDDDLQHNIREVHIALFPDNAEEFELAFPVMA